METDKDYRAGFFVLSMIAFSPVAVLVLFSGVVAYLHTTGEAVPVTGMIQPFSYLVPAVMVMALGIAPYAFRFTLSKITGDLPLRQKFLKYQNAVIIRMAIVEVPGILGAAAALITGELYFLAAPLLVALVSVMLRPGPFNMANDLSLSTDERTALQGHPASRYRGT